jgi:hypothetical protein
MRLYRTFIRGLLLIPLAALILPLMFSVPHSKTVGASSSFPANIDYEGLTGYGNYNPAALANPNIGAVDVSMNWSQVEPEQGVFNWGPADSAMAAWSARGKKFTLIIRYVTEDQYQNGCNNSKQFLPTWEIARIPTFCDSDQGIVIPDYFNATFQADLKAYVQAIATHVAAGPYKNNLLYVRAGVGMGGEGFPYFQKGDYLTVDEPQLERYGYTPTAWAAWQKEMMSAYQQAFSYTTVIYPVDSLATDPATGKQVQVENAWWAAAQGMGIGAEGLIPTTNAPLFQQIRAQYPKIYIQFSTLWSVGNTAGIFGDMQAAKLNGGQFIEWYSPDAVSAANQSIFAQWQQYAQSVAAGALAPRRQRTLPRYRKRLKNRP